jgi:putative hydrolase of the HAD superfamily
MGRRFDILFSDATDTLLHVRGSVGALYAEAAARHGFASTAEVIDAAFRAAMTAAPPPCFPGADAARLDHLEEDWWRDIVRRTFAPLGPFPRFDAFFAEVFAAFRTPRAWDLLPGTRETIEMLHAAGRRLAIVSDMDARLLDVLERLELRHRFEPIVLSTRSGCSKRDGTLFAVALEQARVPPERAAHVGDSLTSDVEAARARGIAPLWFAPAGDGAPPPGVPRIRSWTEIPAALNHLEAASGSNRTSEIR